MLLLTFSWLEIKKKKLLYQYVLSVMAWNCFNLGTCSTLVVFLMQVIMKWWMNLILQTPREIENGESVTTTSPLLPRIKKVACWSVSPWAVRRWPTPTRQFMGSSVWIGRTFYGPCVCITEHLQPFWSFWTWARGCASFSPSLAWLFFSLSRRLSVF